MRAVRRREFLERGGRRAGSPSVSGGCRTPIVARGGERFAHGRRKSGDSASRIA
jgi:hypothetical protein